jgi:hypothetical protein
MVYPASMKVLRYFRRGKGLILTPLQIWNASQAMTLAAQRAEQWRVPERAALADLILHHLEEMERQKPTEGD